MEAVKVDEVACIVERFRGRIGHIYPIRRRIGHIYPLEGRWSLGGKGETRIMGKSGEEVITSSLVNSGFESETPQLLIPKALASRLNLWPPPPEAQLVEVGTAGGPVRNYLASRALQVYVETGDSQ
ncbi:MAG: hypothetical protein RMI78_05560 [Nitrososphaerota archaeon]|nr:hypothetical protein [Nitrososphaerota archaeon]